jgi:hypothetical protein
MKLGLQAFPSANNERRLRAAFSLAYDPILPSRMVSLRQLLRFFIAFGMRILPLKNRVGGG